jgi:redox-sensitive bicupin YhaK (pirin superfamily)
MNKNININHPATDTGTARRDASNGDEGRTRIERKVRSASRIINSMKTIEGGGFVVNRAFPTQGLSDLDPFQLLDEMGPMDVAPGEAKGAPDHPHRGFETVTYMLEGSFEHKDSEGHFGRLSPGDVQWMTAGSGVIHSEMPGKDFLRTGGRMHGFQLWVNLPKRDKMIKPRYQEIPNSKIPVGRSADGKVTAKVIAGEALGAKAAIETRTPIMYLHFVLQPGAEVIQPVPADYNAFAYVVKGEGNFGEENFARRGQIVAFDKDGDSISIKTSQGLPLELLLIAGVPLNEPVARYGPFVMNTPEEIDQALEDYRNGRMGQIST